MKKIFFVITVLFSVQSMAVQSQVLATCFSTDAQLAVEVNLLSAADGKFLLQITEQDSTYAVSVEQVPMTQRIGAPVTYKGNEHLLSINFTVSPRNGKWPGQLIRAAGWDIYTVDLICKYY